MAGKQHLIAYPGGNLSASPELPGDKSITHRAIILSAISEGTSRIKGFLKSDDCLSTIDAFSKMGVETNLSSEGHLLVQGAGINGLRPPQGEISLGNSGTAMRLLSGLLPAQTFDSVLTGDSSLQKRPMDRIREPLELMGAAIRLTKKGTAPINIEGGRMLRGITYNLPTASAQVKSALLLAALYTNERTILTEESVTRDHTERMLETFSYPISYLNQEISIQGGSRLRATEIEIPRDISSAAFFILGALISERSKIILKGIGINETRVGVLSILKMMGGKIEIHNKRTLGNEFIADISVMSSTLHGGAIPQNLVSIAIDEFPCIFIAAAVAKGKTVLENAAELRIKESDRIQVMAAGLPACGAQVETSKDGLVIQGGKLKGGTVDAKGDHRVAMAFAMASLATSEKIHISDTRNISTSYPDFVKHACLSGIQLEMGS